MAFEMPDVNVGQTVHWYPGGDRGQKPHAAFVTSVGHLSVSLNILSPNHHNFFLRDGVRHMADPEVRRSEFQEMGGWEHTPETKLLHRLAARLEAKPAQPQQK